MGSDKISKKLLKKMGLSHLEKDLVVDSAQRLEDGKEKHRQYLQNLKNDLIRKEKDKGLRPKVENDFFNFRTPSPDYSSLKSLLKEKDWENLELD